MDLVSLGKEVLQNIAEHAASYRLGQSALKQLDRGLWIVEKCARWAVPPPLDQDERPQPELVRPLPWVFFIMVLLGLRVARETVSLANLLMGKPPLRSADVVTFIQSKRRYIRALKYQGNRVIRARAAAQEQSWYSAIHSLFELTMCFRRQSNYGNNNTTRTTNYDEVVVIKRKNRGRQEEVPPTPSETTMERLIEKMMVDLDAESDEDANSALANAVCQRDVSDLPESDLHNPPTTPQNTEISQTNGDDIHFSPNKNEYSSSTPEKEVDENKEVEEENSEVKGEIHKIKEDNKKDIVESKEVKGENEEVKEQDKEVTAENKEFKEDNVNVKGENQENKDHTKENSVTNEYQTANSDDFDANEDSAVKASEKQKLNENVTETGYTGNSISENSSTVNQNSENLSSVNQNSENAIKNENSEQKSCVDSALPAPEEKRVLKPKEETQEFLKSETLPQIPQKTPKTHKIANGRTVKSVPSKKKGVQKERRETNEVPQHKVLPSNSSF